MSNTTTIVTRPLLFDFQIPVADVDSLAFKEAIEDKEVLCFINGIRVNNPRYKDVSIAISFKIMEELEVYNPGTSVTGKSLFKNSISKENVQFKNVTLTFDVNKTIEDRVIEITNEHEVYSIISNVLKSKGLMDKSETGSIRVYYPRLNGFLSGAKVYLTSTKIRMSTYEVTGRIGSETQ